MRIVSLAPSNTEILYALGAQDNIVAVTRFCDYPADAKDKTRISGWTDVDVPKIVALKPDLVLTSSVVQAKIAQALKAEGLTVIHLDPKNLEDVLETFLKIGHAVNRGETARKLIIDTEEALAKVAKGVDLGKKIYVEEWNEPPTASANWVPDLLQLIGCKSIVKSGQYSAPTSTEDVQKFNPDAIVLAWCGFGTKADEQSVVQRDGWGQLDAIQKGNVFILDDSLLNRPGPRLVEGLKLLIEVAKQA